MTISLLTNSRMDCARKCLRKHQIRYELGWAPDVDKIALRVGSCYHKMHELHAKGEDPWPALLDLDSEFDKQTVGCLWTGYVWRWEQEPLKLIATELPFETDVVNPETGGTTPLWKFAGKIDAIAELADGRLALIERKTTSEDIDPDSTYWMRLRMDQQITGYFLAARQLGYDVQTVLYDVVRKPDMRPLKATPPDKRKYTKEGKLYAAQREQDETPDEWSERLRTDIGEKPLRYYGRMEIPRLEADIVEFREELWQQQLSLRSCQRSGHWFRNTSACVFPYTCEYLNICSQGLDPSRVPEGFKVLPNVHPELGGDARAEQAAQSTV